MRNRRIAPDGQDDYTSSADVARSTFASHPWSVGGGGAADLKDQLESACNQKLLDIVHEIGFGAVTREDDVYWEPHVRRLHFQRVRGPHSECGTSGVWARGLVAYDFCVRSGC